MQSQHQSTDEGRVALAELCQRYWYPLFAYVRSLGHDFHLSQELTQGFFERLVEKNYVGDADPARGKFRTFLLTLLTNFLANEYDKRTALKRGGARKQLSLEWEDAERRFAIEPSTADSPAARFEEQWARSLLDRIIEQVRQSYIDAGKAQLFENIKQYLDGSETESAATIGARLGMREAAVRVAAHRLRAKYRELLRAEITSTVFHPSEVDDEIAALFAAFSRKEKNFPKKM
ncbi:MAG: RNA polymerase subunit sigma-24 [Pirellulaceae bacterium]|nr:RNA polymerase subunit sigma-24 [Pirellulaceae bacterium]